MKSSLLSILKFSAILFLAAALPSCLQNETTILLNKNGSGTIIEETFLTPAMLQMSAQFAQPGSPDPLENLYSEEKAKAKAAKCGDLVEFVKIEKIEKAGMKGSRTHYKFSDINKLSITPQSALENLGSGLPIPADKGKEPLKFEFSEGKLTIEPPVVDFSNLGPASALEGQDPQMAQMMQDLIADMQIAVRFKATDGIAKTDATYLDADTITLFDVQAGKMLAQKAQLTAIAETAKTDRAAAITEFKKLDGVKIETAEKITVELK